MNDQQNGFKEAVCVEVERIYDCCEDKDCLQDLPVTLDSGVVIGEGVTIVKSKNVEVTDASIHIEPVPFNKGFYSVDITYTFRVTLDTYETASSTPVTVTGTSVFTKKVILYGSQGNTKTFSSDGTSTNAVAAGCTCFGTLPKARVQVVEPIVLDSKLVTKYCCDTSSTELENPCSCCCETRRIICGVAITLGLFSIVQLTRTVSVTIPIYDFCIPQKDCNCGISTESPCEMFDKIQFPTDVFFPPALDADTPPCGCEC